MYTYFHNDTGAKNERRWTSSYPWNAMSGACSGLRLFAQCAFSSIYNFIQSYIQCRMAGLHEDAIAKNERGWTSYPRNATSGACSGLYKNTDAKNEQRRTSYPRNAAIGECENPGEQIDENNPCDNAHKNTEARNSRRRSCYSQNATSGACSELIVAKNRTPRPDDFLTQIPEHIRNGIGKYGTELVGNISDTSDSINDAMSTLRDYVVSLDLPTHQTYHTFEDNVNLKEHTAIQTIKYGPMFSHISQSYPNHLVIPIVAMNELYVSCLGGDGSDRVFETPHIDGLFAWLPWCIVLRSIVAIQGNSDVHTIFPLSNNTYTLETGYYVAFDYNRSLHYICGNDGISSTRVDQSLPTPDTRARIILKLHYLVFPQWLPYCVSRAYVWIHGTYNAFLRGLFLKSQFSAEQIATKTPERIYDKWIAFCIQNGTILYVKVFMLLLYLFMKLNYIFG
jgi:hypothetical protein